MKFTEKSSLATLRDSFGKVREVFVGGTTVKAANITPTKIVIKKGKPNAKIRR